MLDAYDRPITYLRVSVIDRCNLRCAYCMPADGVQLKSREEILNFDEIQRVVEAAAQLGVRRVRLTGGEPLVRAGLSELVASIANTPGIEEVSLTTNGLLLSRYAKTLAQAGLRRVNVSLDTLLEERFRYISRIGRGVERVLEAIRVAKVYGLTPIKPNTVIVRGFNEDELGELARLTMIRDWHVRFIELMPVGQCVGWDDGRFVSADEMQEQLESELGALLPTTPPPGGGPAKHYRLAGAKGTVGFVTPVSDHFCDRCNRLRLTADGKLLPCLLSDAETDLRTILRSGATAEELRNLIGQAIARKPQGHHLQQQVVPASRVMAQIGG